MSIPHPFQTFQESQPEVRIETFEDLTTVRRAIGEVKGFEDPVTTELREDLQHSLDLANRDKFEYQFQPKSIVGDEAKTVVRALRAVAINREDALAKSAADALSRMPMRLRAATFITDLVKPEVPKPPVEQSGARYPLFAPYAEQKRPEIEWKSKYDQSDPKNRPS